jgi:hypothetical protein
LLLAILGDSILRVWMGADYSASLLVGVLAAGFLVTIAHQAILSILTGINAHGRPGLARLVAAVATVGMAALALGPLGWGLVGAAIAVVLPLTVVDGIYMPDYASRRFGLSPWRFIADVYRDPVIHTSPFAACLVAARVLFADRPGLCLTAGLAGGGLLLGWIYWKRVLPDSVRGAISRRLAAVAGSRIEARL